MKIAVTPYFIYPLRKGTTPNVSPPSLIDLDEQRFRRLADSMPQIVYVSGADGVLEFVNDRWIDYTGLTLEQSRDQALMEQLIPPEDNQQLQADFIQAQKTRSPYQSQFRLLQPDGNYLYFLTRAIPILDEQGQIRKWYGTSTDIIAAWVLCLLIYRQ
ncbi:MAG: hypothetical protein C4288_10780 [Leptolyngbya sp. ERB_1_1]